VNEIWVIIFRRNVAVKINNQNNATILIGRLFPPPRDLTTVSTLPDKTINAEITSFHLNAECYFANRQRKQIKYHLVTVKPSHNIKTIDRMYQWGQTRKKQEVRYHVIHTLDVYQVCHTHSVNRSVNNGSCSSPSLYWKLLDCIYCWLLTVISYHSQKFYPVFISVSIVVLAHIAFNTVQLLQCKIPNFFPSFGHLWPRWLWVRLRAWCFLLAFCNSAKCTAVETDRRTDGPQHCLMPPTAVGAY